MKLRISYEKNKKGEINATVSCVDSGNFPSSDIFREGGTVSLGTGYWSWYTRTFQSVSEAEVFISEVISEVKAQLRSWEDIQLPENREVEIA